MDNTSMTPTQYRDYALKRIRTFMEMAEKTNDPLNIEADFYAIQGIADRTYQALRRQNSEVRS